MCFLGPFVAPWLCFFWGRSLFSSLFSPSVSSGRLSCALVVSLGMFVPSLCGVAVLVSVHLRLRVSWKYWGAWGGSIVPYSMAGGYLAIARSRFVFSRPVSLLLLFRLGYSFGWPGCVFMFVVSFVCSVGLSFSVLSSLSLSLSFWPLVALPWDFRAPWRTTY